MISFSAKKRSASSAAIHPVPAAVTACLNTLSCKSPQAYTPSTLVLEESALVKTYPTSSVSKYSLKTSEFGL
jgi:hypothetical protein